MTSYEQMQKRVAELQAYEKAEQERLKLDAERYQWLRKNGFALTGDLCKKLVPVCLFEDADSAVDRQMAIDAAMKGNP